MASVLIAVTAWWDIHLLGTSSTFLPWLRYALAVGAAVAIFLILMAGRLRNAVTGIALVATLVGLGGPAAYAVDTASKAHTGSIPSSGPSTGMAASAVALPAAEPAYGQRDGAHRHRTGQWQRPTTTDEQHRPAPC